MKIWIQITVFCWIVYAYFQVVQDMFTGRPAEPPRSFGTYLSFTAGTVFFMGCLAYCGTFSEIVGRVRNLLNREENKK